MTPCTDNTCRTCPDCRLARKRRHAKDRKASQRQAEEYAAVEMPLFDVTERTDWIERMLAVEDQKKRRRQGWHDGR